MLHFTHYTVGHAHFAMYVFVSFLIWVVLAVFASRISIRLSRLRDEAERAIDQHGRVVGAIGDDAGGDEIGDLARSFASLLERLRLYNDYLERLARRLSHELRTPIAVVRSSLDNLAHATGDGEEPYLHRARDGVDRLNAIILRMSEATRIEQTLEDFDAVADMLEPLGHVLCTFNDGEQELLAWGRSTKNVPLNSTFHLVNRGKRPSVFIRPRWSAIGGRRS